MKSSNKPTVLVVEDNERLRELYGRWLSETHRVVTARSATEALDVFDDLIDLVLLDRRMPDASGDGVLAEMRGFEADVRIAMVTAVEPTDDVVDLGFDEYLCKPVDAETLRDLVARLVQRAEFGTRVNRQFVVARKIALLEKYMTDAELEASEAYEELRREYDDLNTDLVDTVDDLSHEDLGAVIGGH
jgi:DNA-binding response OmpR family regulator